MQVTKKLPLMRLSLCSSISSSWQNLLNYITFISINSWTWVINSYSSLIWNFLFNFSFFFILIKFWTTPSASIKYTLFKTNLDYDQANINFIMETKYRFLSFFKECYTVISLMLFTLDEKFSYILTSTDISKKKKIHKWK